MDLRGETGNLCSCWMGAHSDDPKSIFIVNFYSQFSLVGVRVTGITMCFSQSFFCKVVLICAPKWGKQETRVETLVLIRTC